MLTLQLPFSGAYTEVLHAHADTSAQSQEINPRNTGGYYTGPPDRPARSGNRYHSAGEMLQERNVRGVQHRVEEALEAEEQVRVLVHAGGSRVPSFLCGLSPVSVYSFVLLYWFLGWSLPFNLDGCLAR